MTPAPDVSDREVEEYLVRIQKDAESGGYHLNPDLELTRSLIKGIIINQKRYGYRGCPCRLCRNNKERDLDIICPCYYRDQDLTEFGNCYCALYVSEDILNGKKETGPIPERRPPAEKRETSPHSVSGSAGLSVPVWRCRVCGYLCGRPQPPAKCPVCHSASERFERFME